jgi:hypothetical protein
MRRRGNGCAFCGGPCTTPCVDNDGGKYLGCDRGCRIKPNPPTEDDIVRAHFVTLITFVAQARASSAMKNEALNAIQKLQARLLP